MNKIKWSISVGSTSIRVTGFIDNRLIGSRSFKNPHRVNIARAMIQDAKKEIERVYEEHNNTKDVTYTYFDEVEKPKIEFDKALAELFKGSDSE